MKLSRRDALQARDGLLALEKSPHGKQYDFDWDVWDKIFKMLEALTPVVETYNKTRSQRFLAASNGKGEIPDNSEAFIQFTKENEASLDQIISVKMPKDPLTEANLKLSQNKIPPSVRLQLKAVIYAEKSETDNDENEY